MAFLDNIIDPSDVEGQGDPYLNDYEVDHALIKRQNLRYIGTDSKGNRMWKGTGGSIYYARDLAKTNYGTSDNQEYEGGQSDNSDNGSYKRRNNDTSDSVTDATPTTDTTEVLSSGGPAWMPENQGYSAPKRKPTSSNIPAPKPAKRVWNDDSVLSSFGEVTQKPVLNNEGEEETPTIKTYFIEQRGGKFLGESKAYYKYVRENKIQEKLVTLPELNINLRSIPNYKVSDDKVPGDGNHLDFDRDVFSSISEPIVFKKKEYNEGFKEMVKINIGEDVAHNWKEQSLVIVYNYNKLDDYTANAIAKATLDFPGYPTTSQVDSVSAVARDKAREDYKLIANNFNAITSIVLSDRINFETKDFLICNALPALTITMRARGSYLIPFEFWEKAMDNYLIIIDKQSTKKAYNEAKVYRDTVLTKAALENHQIVIGISHTHPDRNIPPDFKSSNLNFRAKYVDSAHSGGDEQNVKSNHLPDVIVSFKRYNTDVKKIEVLTYEKPDSSKYTEVAKNLNNFVAHTEDILLNSIVRKYTEYAKFERKIY